MKRRSDSNTRKWSLGALAAHVLLGAAAIACVVAFPYIPTHDGPQHIFGGHVAGALDQLERGYATHLMLGNPITALGFHAVYRLTPEGWSWMARTQSFLVLLVLVYGLGFSAVVRRFAGRWTAAGAIGFALTFQWAFYMGFFPFMMGSALALWALALHRVGDAWLDARSALSASVLLVAAISHVFPAAAVGVVILALELGASTGPRLKGLARAALIGTPSVALVVLTAALTVEGLASATPAEWSSLRGAITTSPRMFASGPLWRWAPVWVGGLAGLVLALRGSWAAGAPAQLDPPERELRALAFGVGTLVVLGCVTPLSALGWQFFSPRFIALGLALALALLLAGVARGTARAQRAIGAAALAWGVAALGWVATHHAHLLEQSAGIMQGLDAEITRDGPRLGLVLIPQLDEPASREARTVPFAQPWKNLVILMATAQGGFPADFFGSVPAIHPVIERPDAMQRRPPAPNPNFYLALQQAHAQGDALLETAILTELAAAGAAWQDVVLFGPQAWADPIIARGYAVDFESADGGLRIARFRGCPVQVLLPPSEQAQRIALRAAWTPLLEPSAGQTLALPPSDEPRVLPVPAAPCGPVRVWVFDDRDDDGRVSAADRVCRGSQEGVFAFESSPQGVTIECVWTTP